MAYLTLGKTSPLARNFFSKCRIAIEESLSAHKSGSPVRMSVAPSNTSLISHCHIADIKKYNSSAGVLKENKALSLEKGYANDIDSLALVLWSRSRIHHDLTLKSSVLKLSFKAESSSRKFFARRLVISSTRSEHCLSVSLSLCSSCRYFF